MMATHDVNPLGEQNVTRQKPWYRHGWVWFLISFPAASVLAGIMMITLSLNTNNSMVVDDYYKYGKTFNLRKERDTRARELGLHASLLSSPDGIELTIGSRLEEDSIARGEPPLKPFAPAAVHLRWVHVTQADRDGEAVLLRGADGRYRSTEELSLPDSDNWRFHLDADNADWRLVSGVVSATPGQVFRFDADHNTHR